METRNLLIELSTEELPPKALKKLSESFTDSIVTQLQQANLLDQDNDGSVESFATPRRLGVLVHNVLVKQPDEDVERKGPAISAAFDQDGNPTKAALGWARGQGIEVDQAGRLATDKGEWLVYNARVEGQSISKLLPSFVEKAAKSLPVPKMMRWGEGSHAFIRPLKHLTVMLDHEVVPMSLFGIQASNVVLGHRFHGEPTVEISDAVQYEDSLTKNNVIASFAKRRKMVVDRTLALTGAANLSPVWDEDLIDEVTALVEFPVALEASFDESFLDVPKEALIYTMKDDQRYFPLVDNSGKLHAKFVFISNIESSNPSAVISGNEKVIRPRLADAQFFYETDKKSTLASRLTRLDSVLFQKKLGTVGDKARRLELVAGKVANLINANVEVSSRAGLLAKADLVSDMVSEFPEVQGVMGMHYANNDGEAEGVGLAIEAQYRPRFAGDELPSTLEGAAVAIADKLDTLVGIFGIGQTPKGDKDPFALRRAAIGLLRILVEKELHVGLDQLVSASVESYKGVIEVSEDIQDEIVNFLLGRFRTSYQEQGISVDVIQAVLARRPLVPLDFDQRVKAVQTFKANDVAESLAAANKRVGNILSKSEADLSTLSISQALFQEPQEQELFDALSSLQKDSSDGYKAVLEELATLRAPIDAFFDNVMVNADDEKVKHNRLALLSKLHQAFLNVADIGLLQS
ncbi:glycine--tRNA ligase subunit beta [Aliidiomarina sp. B3213]|uniref:glycine--tRNA ligase subunit beta n=1 Tax=Aliidiomarina sp. B3213 TaxID=2249757 RepID=UPI001A9DFC56|nr:glycine--tRNA ligase subunit beta [Aliidiomarina sp. B3213]